MEKKFEKINLQNKEEKEIKITAENIDELAEKLSSKVEERIKNASSKNKKNFWFNCSKIFSEYNLDFGLRFELAKKIKNIIKEKNKNFDWRIFSALREQFREEKRAGQSYFDSDL
ncbi:MAG: hypothetical protein GWO87_00460 [Xanthomonadaceae bacterium]|nr:hypothetical protein [Rhodospirillaceae bacterium]NIA17653.1 hypothetical protein [Xanthomonadaceae bacterium]